MTAKQASAYLRPLRATAVRRLTFGGNNRLPTWSSDGTHIAFQPTANVIKPFSGNGWTEPPRRNADQTGTR